MTKLTALSIAESMYGMDQLSCIVGCNVHVSVKHRVSTFHYFCISIKFLIYVQKKLVHTTHNYEISEDKLAYSKIANFENSTLCIQSDENF